MRPTVPPCLQRDTKPLPLVTLCNGRTRPSLLCWFGGRLRGGTVRAGRQARFQPMARPLWASAGGRCPLLCLLTGDSVSSTGGNVKWDVMGGGIPPGAPLSTWKGVGKTPGLRPWTWSGASSEQTAFRYVRLCRTFTSRPLFFLSPAGLNGGPPGYGRGTCLAWRCPARLVRDGGRLIAAPT